MSKEIFALGVGHLTPVLIELALSNGYSIGGLYHYCESRTNETVHGYKILGSFDDLFTREIKGKNFLLTMGDIKIRRKLVEKILLRGGHVPTLIHPTAVISKFAEIDDTGVYIRPFSYVEADCKIGMGTTLSAFVKIFHTTNIGRFCSISGGALIGAYTTIEDCVFVGMGALTISGKVNRIGENAFIGARSMVTKEIEPGAMVVGSPAKPIK